MKIAVIGKSGQVATELSKLADSDLTISCFGRNNIDVDKADSVSNTLGSNQFDAVINASAYTAVDLAESEREDAFALNANAVSNLAQFCEQEGCYFLHISTDFVFDGLKSAPYHEDDLINPIGVYGESKAEGEKLVTNAVSDNWAIVRTSWVYSSVGNNFVKTMLRLMSDKEELGVVGDQIGTPTSAKSLAETLVKMCQQKVAGLFHYTDAGVASWYDFAVAIQNIAFEKELLSKKIPVKSITTSDYPTPAKRPSYSVLDKTKILKHCDKLELAHWQVKLSEVLDEIKQGVKN